MKRPINKEIPKNAFLDALECIRKPKKTRVLWHVSKLEFYASAQTVYTQGTLVGTMFLIKRC